MRTTQFRAALWSACRALAGVALLAIAMPAQAQVIRKTVYLSKAEYAKKYAAKPSRSAPSKPVRPAPLAKSKPSAPVRPPYAAKAPSAPARPQYAAKARPAPSRPAQRERRAPAPEYTEALGGGGGGTLLDITEHRRQEVGVDGKVRTTVSYTQN